MSRNFDPIFALATSSARSALHLHRVSGENIFNIFSPFVYLPYAKSNLNLNKLASNSFAKPVSRYVNIVDENKNSIDDVIITLYSAPKSYTGENIIEISVHGNPLISAKLQSLLRSLGMRDAEPGEFTQRAVLNGKLDLAQAEGINQLIHTETLGGIELARKTVDGLLSKETEEIREQIIIILSYLEAHIDFAPDEVGDYDPKSLIPQIENAKQRLQALLSTYSSGLKMREGVKVVLAGKPNAGKSSLYNSLLRYDRAIVTDIPGTTRDVLEDRFAIQNKDFVLVDTAGIRLTFDTVEKIGVERSLQSASIADVICLVIDVQTIEPNKINEYIVCELNHFFSEVKLSGEQKIVIVVSKQDILSTEQLNEVNNFENNIKSFSFEKKFIIDNLVLTSTLDNSALCLSLVDLHTELTGNVSKKESPTLISIRQKDKVELSIKYLNEALALISVKDYPEKVASIINHSRQSLEEIVGEINLDNVLEKIFSTFCIGK